MTVADRRQADDRGSKRPDVYLFDRVVVRIHQTGNVWTLTEHGQALGEGLAAVRHCLLHRRKSASARGFETVGDAYLETLQVNPCTKT